jgi:hypothetical protein
MAAGRIETLRAEGFLVEGELEGTGEQDLAPYQWTESISETDIEGLYEVIVTVRHSKSEQPIYELSTLLFDPPLASTEPTQSSTPAQGERPRNRRGR